MFIEMSEHLNQAKTDLLAKAKHTSSDADHALMAAGINVVFETLQSQLKCLEREVVKPLTVDEEMEFQATLATPAHILGRR